MTTTEKVRLDGQVAIVTGSGRRLGRLHALALASRGAAVVVNDVDEQLAERTAGEIENGGGRAVIAAASVATPEGAAEIVDAALRTFGTVDVVVNNAGFMRNAYIGQMTPQMMDDVLGVHVGGSFYLSQAAWPTMADKGYGRIVMTSSSGGLFAMQAEANYAAAKAGVYGLTKALAFEGRDVGIKVNAILPHANALDDDNAGMDAAEQERWNEQNWGVPDAMRYFSERDIANLSRRTASNVPPIVVYLSSSQCGVSGEAFAAGYGRFARVFVGEGPGWARADGALPSADDVAENFTAIRSADGGTLPSDLYEEMAYIGRATDGM